MDLLVKVSERLGVNAVGSLQRQAAKEWYMALREYLDQEACCKAAGQHPCELPSRGIPGPAQKGAARIRPPSPPPHWFLHFFRVAVVVMVSSTLVQKRRQLQGWRPQQPLSLYEAWGVGGGRGIPLGGGGAGEPRTQDVLIPWRSEFVGCFWLIQGYSSHTCLLGCPYWARFIRG